MAKLRIECEGSSAASIDELSEFQGELKTIKAKSKAKLRRSITQYGFSAPIFVWEHDGRREILDGHQRLRVLREMRNEGWTIPKIPIVEIRAEDEATAKRKLLSIASQYGDVSKQGLREFAADLDLQEVALSIRLTSGELDLSDPRRETEAEVEFTEELGEKHNYVVLYFDNEVDWLQAQTALGLKTVRAKSSKKGYEKKGVGRVVYGPDAMNRLRDG